MQLTHIDAPITTKLSSLLIAWLVAIPAAAAPFAGQDGQIRGTVVEATSGRPIAAVRIDVVDHTGIAITDTNGAFTLTLPEGTWTVRATAVGYGTGRVPVAVVAGGTIEVTITLEPGTQPYTERVTVRPAPMTVAPPAVADFRLDGGALHALRGALADDPLRAVQAAPAVIAGDDFRAEFAIRGHGPRQLGFTLDGMDTRLLVHSVRGVADTGSLAIFNTDVLQSAAIAMGPYPQRDAGRLGARVTFDLRDGSRERFRAQGLVSGTAAGVLAEGPLGHDRRASLLASVRRSYLDWLIRRIDPDVDETFGFTDALARVAWQVSTRHTVRLTTIGARSALRGQDEANEGPNSLRTGRSTTALVNAEWQTSVGQRLFLTQRLWTARADFRNETFAGGAREAGNDRELTYRFDAMWSPAPAVLVEGGGRLGTTSAEREARTFAGNTGTLLLAQRRSARTQAGWGAVTARARALTLSGGARVERVNTSPDVTASPWTLAEWRPDPRTAVRAGASLVHQHPGLDDVPPPGEPLRPERAWTADAGVERQTGAWTASLTTYLRDESEGLRAGSELLVRDHVVRRRVPGVRNRYDGRAWGVETLIRRSAAVGLSGWLGYAVGRHRLFDVVTGERFDSDFGQRHTVSAFAQYRRSPQTSASVRWRAGSNLPISGYVERVGESYYLSTARNTTRLPLYSRLDVRVDRRFRIRERELTLFAEVLNVLNRRNLAPGDPTINTRTGVIRDAVESLFPVLPSAGLLVAW